MHMFGPIAGSHHDSYLLAESKILVKLAIKLEKDGCQFNLYGDKAYAFLDNVMSPFLGDNLIELQSAFNKLMSKVRVSVEWGFGMISKYWAFCDFQKNQKVYL